MKKFLAASLLVSNSAFGQPVAGPLQVQNGLGEFVGQTALQAKARQSIAVVNAATITPLTTTVGTISTTIFSAAPFYSVRIKLLSGGPVACTGDGSTPIVNTSVTISYVGQSLYWPTQPGGAMPTGAVKCIATASATILTEAH